MAARWLAGALKTVSGKSSGLGLGTRLHDLMIKPLGVNDAAIGNRENQSGARCLLRVELQFRVFQCSQSRDNSESRNRAGSTQARMGRRPRGRLGRHGEYRVGASQRTRNGLGRCCLTILQAVPDAGEITPERRHPTHARDSQAHASIARIMTEAFVPPKPKEFDRTVRRLPGWELFAMMLRSSPASPLRKLMFGGRN